MRKPLGAIAYDCDFLSFEKAEIGIFIVINFHNASD
jgi:hypothetical protein